MDDYMNADYDAQADEIEESQNYGREYQKEY